MQSSENRYKEIYEVIIGGATSNCNAPMFRIFFRILIFSSVTVLQKFYHTQENETFLFLIPAYNSEKYIYFKYSAKHFDIFVHLYEIKTK